MTKKTYRYVYTDSDGRRHIMHGSREVAESQPTHSAEEIEAMARSRRNRLLSDCDWRLATDAPVSALAKVEWTAYRQALRDVPQQAGFPDTIDWPTPPED